MEQFKIENFEREHPGARFPSYRSLSEVEVRQLRDRVLGKLALDYGTDGLSLVTHIAARGVLTSPLRKHNGAIDLDATLQHLGLLPTRMVYLNWYRFDQIDEMQFIDLASYFEDIHYESVDDLDILDAGINWIVSVSHDNTVQLLTLSSPTRHPLR